MLKSLFILYNPFIEIEAICKLCLLIDSKLYGTFAKLYTFYVDLAGRKIFSRAALESLTNRIYIFIGIIALFFVAYTLLKAIVDPDKGLKDGGGKLVFNIVSSLIMILVAPIIFELGYKITDIIVNENIIGKIFLGGESISSGDSSFEINYTKKETDNEGNVLSEADLGNVSIKNDISRETLRVYGNQTAYIILNAFLYPLNENFTVNASDEYNLSSGIEYTVKGGLKGAAIGSAGYVGAIVAAGIIFIPFTNGASLLTIPSAIAASTGAIATAAAVGGTVGGVGGAIYQGVGYTITYDEYTWDNAQVAMVYDGNFDIITAFSEAIEAGNMQYTPIISTICGVILLYFMIGFCLDLGIRSAKLAMFEMLAPIPILLRIVPGQDKVFKTWITQVLSTFFDVIIRIGILFGVAYLISLVPSMTIFANDSVGMFGKAFIVLGLVAFIKEAPKLLSEVIGIKGAGNIKFNLKDKLAATGAFTAGAAIGGGAVGLLRNSVNAGKNVKDSIDKHKKTGGKWTSKEIMQVGKKVGTGVLSTVAGGVSGAARSGYAARNAKNYSDVKTSTTQGTQSTTEARVKRANYKAAYGDGTFLGNVKGVVKGHVADALTKAGGFAGIKNLADIKRENSDMTEITSTRDSFDSSAEALILKELGKGKMSLNLGTLGANLNFSGLKAAQAKLQEAQQSGIGLQAAQEEYNKVLKNLVFELEDATLKSAKSWDAQSEDVRAKLSGIRTEAIKFKGVIRNHISLGALQDAELTGLEFADDVDYTLSREIWVDSAGNEVAAGTAGARFDRYDNNLKIDAMEKSIKIRKGANDIEIATREQKPEEKK